MDYLIIGGDERFRRLATMLERMGFSVALNERDPEALARARNVVAGCSPKGGEWQALRRSAEQARLLLCGPGHPEAGDGSVVDLWADETLVLENAQLTAEGAVASAMRASDRALRDTRCLVVGWGRIGRALTEILVPLGANVTVASRTEAGRNRAVERGADAVDTARVAEALPGRGLIFNTAPGMVLDGKALGRADRDAMIIDLASPPYGVDLREAWRMGLRAWREPGLPGRYCPESAARALLKAIRRQGI